MAQGTTSKAATFQTDDLFNEQLDARLLRQAVAKGHPKHPVTDAQVRAASRSAATYAAGAKGQILDADVPASAAGQGDPTVEQCDQLEYRSMLM